MKTFSICLITANRPLLLEQAINSIQKLSRKDYSVVISDNSSTNESEVIVKKILPNARYHLNIPPLNEMQNSNKCLSDAKTEIICLLHDDDKFNKSYFDEIISQMNDNKDIDIAYTGRRIVDQNDELIANQLIKSGKEQYIYQASDILDFMLLGKHIADYKVPVNTPGLVFRKSLFEKIGKFDESIDTHCDTDFLLKALSFSKKVLYVNEPLYISKIWYGLSGRTKTSERGDVFFAEKAVIDNFLSFAKRNKLKRVLANKEAIYRKYAQDAISFNGPFIWIPLRFKGSMTKRCNAIFRTTRSLISLYNGVLYQPKFYLVFLIGFLSPQWLLKLAQKFLLPFYFR